MVGVFRLEQSERLPEKRPCKVYYDTRGTRAPALGHAVALEVYAQRPDDFCLEP